MEFKSKYSSAKQEAPNIPNNLYDYICKGIDIVGKEISALELQIDLKGNNAPKMFFKKIDLLVDLGNQMLKIKECYEFNRK